MENTPEFNFKKRIKNLLKHRSKKSIAFEIVLIILLIYSFMFIMDGFMHMDSDIAIKISAYILLAFCFSYLFVCCFIMKNYSNIRELINATNDKFAVIVDIYTIILLVINVLFYLYYFVSFISTMYVKNDSFESLILYSTLMIPYIDAFQYPIMYCFRYRRLPRIFLKFKVDIVFKM